MSPERVLEKVKWEEAVWERLASVSPAKGGRETGEGEMGRMGVKWGVWVTAFLPLWRME